MKFDSKFPWFIFDTFLFIGLNAVLLWVFYHRGIQVTFTPFKIIIMAVAVYRGANIIANETITKAFRSPFVKLVEKDGKQVEEPYVFGFRGAMGTLLYCPSCCGMWVAMVLVYGFLFWPKVFGVIIIILALSGMERFFAILMQYVRANTADK